MVKKGFLKKTGCILISASIILAGWTFAGSSVSEAELGDEPIIDEVLTDENNSGNQDIPTADTNEDGEAVEVPDEETPAAGDTSGENGAPATDPENGDGTTTGSAETGNQGEKTPEQIAEEERLAEEARLAEEERLAEEQRLREEELLSQKSLKKTMLRSSNLLLGASTDDDDGTEPVYSDDGTILEKVPAGVENPLIIQDGTTVIAENAFSGSNVSVIQFVDSSDIVTIHSQGSWPNLFLHVYCPNNDYTDSTAVDNFFTPLVKSNKAILEWRAGYSPDDTYTVSITEKCGSTILGTITYTDKEENDVITPRSYTGYSCSDSYTVTDDDDQSYTFEYVEGAVTTCTVTITEVYGGNSATVIYPNQTEGTIISPTYHPGYVCNDTYTVTSAATQTHTFTYTESSASQTYSVTINEVYGASTYTETVERHEGEVITPTERPGYVCNGTYTVTTEANQSHTFIYAADSSETGLSVIITENYGNTSETIKYTGKAVGDVITPTAHAGYTCSDKYTVTSSTNQSHTFNYTKSSSGGGGSGGGGSSDSGGSSGGSSGGGGAPAPKPNTNPPASGYVSTVAQTTQSYVVTDGANQQVKQNAGPVRIVCNGPVEKLAYILLDGNQVSPSNYTIQSGSTILHFTKEFVNTMSVGDHAVQFQYSDGYAMTGLKVLSPTAKTTTTVTYKVAADGSISVGHTKDTTPKTADGFDPRYLLCMAIFLMGAGAIMMSKQRKLEAILADCYEE
ncbi:hypothetical protein SAMN02910298_01356 [Pseudobutyrivibrio sp. YE44]|uniref:hypothetical protein n=1 Tax=Pseudobutyrivibrio sp. YE44 TaxID=1520802 RepID=UPI000880B28A|nr:hypothetical protein [Pseudobutyrivibrio sp. YE44]SDB28144.1 hypothetical protein SAMN02910298_01356 [Pseudobutyrivibrio sp. YE44]